MSQDEWVNDRMPHQVDPGIDVGVDDAEFEQPYEANTSRDPHLGDAETLLKRAVDIIECYGNERLWINSAGDWGPSDPLSVPKCHVEMRRRGHTQKLVEKISLENPLAFLSQSGRFSLGG